MERTDLATEVAALIGRSGYGDRILDVLDLGLKAISQRHDFKSMTQEAEDVEVDIETDYCTAEIPEGYLRLKSASLVRGTLVYPIEVRTSYWVDNIYPRTGSCRWVGAELPGGVLLIKPDPADGDKVRFVVSIELAWTVSEDEEPTYTCPAGIEQALIAFSASWMFDSLEIPTSSERWRQRYELALRDAIVSDTKGAVVHRPSILREPEVLDDLLGDNPVSIEV